MTATLDAAPARTCRFCDKPVDWFTDGLPEDACLRCAANRREWTAAVNDAYERGRREALADLERGLHAALHAAIHAAAASPPPVRDTL